MSDKTDVTVNENLENDTTELVATVPNQTLKIATIAAASFTAGAAVARLIMNVMAERDVAKYEELVLEASATPIETQD